jgi:ectoine hydroxylase-related dioxygenase (phytanoyl-CoA dioxygenase family)
MANASDAEQASDRHLVTYRVRRNSLKEPVRRVEVHASPAEIQRLVEDGYFVREALLSAEHVGRLSEALDQVAAAEGGEQKSSQRRTFGGYIMRHLMDKHPAFLELLRFPPTLSVARAVLGPLVQVRGFSARISYPNQANQETHWHFHQPLIPEPLPPFFSRPQTLDALIYLDDANDVNGPLCVVPGSHQWIHEDLPREDWSEMPGQVILRPSAGSCVFAHGALWHRALLTRPEGSIRRLLIVGYGPTWMKPSIFGQKPQDGLTAGLLEDADEETLELLGLSGYN